MVVKWHTPLANLVRFVKFAQANGLKVADGRDCGIDQLSRPQHAATPLICRAFVSHQSTDTKAV